MRLIDADALKVRETWDSDGYAHNYFHPYDIYHAPTIDAVEIIRCKDCKHKDDDHYFCYKWAKDDSDFCSRGERSE